METSAVNIRYPVIPDALQFDIPFETLDISTDAVRYGMGYTEDAAPGPGQEVIDDIVAEVHRYAKVRAGYLILPPRMAQIAMDHFLIGATRFDTGTIVGKPLRGAETIAFFVASAGPGLDEWSNACFAEQDFLKGYMVSALGSAIVEQGADWIEAKINEAAAEQGWRATNRYSPGYCDWSVAEQHKLFSFLPEKFCGITLTESALMQPIKSVSGVIGLGKRARKSDYACDVCTMENCFRRNQRRS